MAVRKIPPKKSVQKNRTTATSRTSARVASARPVSKVNKVQHHGGKKKVTKKTNGFLSLFRSDRPAGDVDYTFMLLVGVLVAFGLIMLLSASTHFLP